jgi:hypothetical protein
MPIAAMAIVADISEIPKLMGTDSNGDTYSLFSGITPDASSSPSSVDIGPCSNLASVSFLEKFCSSHLHSTTNIICHNPNGSTQTGVINCGSKAATH